MRSSRTSRLFITIREDFMKVCSACAIEQCLENFSKRGEGYQSKCKACAKDYYVAYYHYSGTERSRLASSNKTRKQDYAERIRGLKMNPCLDCEERFPPMCMDFDHVLGVKSFNIANATNSRLSWSRILDEIAKCELVCANCHRIRTYNRLRTTAA